jgi:trigger factor
MSCTVTVDGPCRRTLTFEVERNRLEQAVEKNIEDYARSVDLKGFRKGKAPIALVRKSHGAQIEEDVRRNIMSEEFSSAVKEHSLHPVGEPEMNLEKLDAEGPGPFTFEFAVEVVPDFEVDVPAEIPVTVTLAEVQDEMVDGEVFRFREQSASLEDASEGAAIAQDDILEGTVVYTIDGEALEPRTDRAVFTKHNLVDSIKIEDSAKEFLGKTKGDTVEFEVTLPDHFAPAEYAGKQATLAFTIDRHRLVILPELNEEFLAQLGVSTEDEMRDRIRQELEVQRSRAREQQVDAEIESMLVERLDFELPDRLLTKAIEHRVHEFAHRLIKERGLESEDGHHQAEERREEIAAATARGLRVAFLLSRIAEDHELKPTAEQTVEQIKGMAAQQQKDPDQLLEEARQEGWISDVFEQLMHQNARTWLRQRAKVTETAPPPPSED